MPGLFGRGLSSVYALAIGRINRKFDRGKGVVRFDRPVISVGNLSVGGTGKTPMVAHIVESLLAAGHRPCIAMRGYGGSSGESDEAAAYRRRFPDVPVVAKANRIHGLIELFGRQYKDELDHSDCIVLDDGFQHRQIARDLDVVLVDASRDPFNDRLLPAGWLREPVASLARAGAVVITHAESAAPAEITALNRNIAQARDGHGADAVSRHIWTGIVVDEGSGDRDLPVSWLSGKRTIAVCAIGNPGPFLAEARKASGGNLAGELVLRDHHPYSPNVVKQIAELAKAKWAQAIITTDKDWSKIKRLQTGAWPCPVARTRLAMQFDQGGPELAALAIEVVAKGVPEDAPA